MRAQVGLGIADCVGRQFDEIPDSVIQGEVAQQMLLLAGKAPEDIAVDPTASRLDTAITAIKNTTARLRKQIVRAGKLFEKYAVYRGTKVCRRVYDHEQAAKREQLIDQQRAIATQRFQQIDQARQVIQNPALILNVAEDA